MTTADGLSEIKKLLGSDICIVSANLPPGIEAVALSLSGGGAVLRGGKVTTFTARQMEDIIDHIGYGRSGPLPHTAPQLCPAKA